MSSRDEFSLAKALSSDGYNQTYIIQSTSIPSESNKSHHTISNNREVFFRCGNWCYKGKVQFNDIDISINNTTLLISTLQKQQTSLRFDCNSSELPASSVYFEPLAFFNDAVEFISQEISSEKTNAELKRMSNIFPWIDADDDDDDLDDIEDGISNGNNNKRSGSKTYFELVLTQVPAYMNSIRLIASKTYSRGLILISIYYEGSIFFVVLPGEGDQGLLDVRFPDVNSHGQGLLIAFFSGNGIAGTDGNGDNKHSDTSSDDGSFHKKDSDFDDDAGYKLSTLTVNNNNAHHQAESKSSSPRIIHHPTKCTSFYQKLTLWQSFGSSNMMMDFNELMAVHHQQPVKIDTTNLTTDGYQQTYIILKEPDRNSSNNISGGSSNKNGNNDDDYTVRSVTIARGNNNNNNNNNNSNNTSSSSAAYRDVLFRFGSWCYTGRIRLVESVLELSDIPIVIPVLRAQQSALEFAYEASQVPVNSPYAAPMEYIHRVITPAVMNMMTHSEVALQSLIDRLSQVGLEASVKSWLEGTGSGEDDDSSFFEFSLSATHDSLECLKDIEAVASKCYLSNGVCAIMIIHQNTVYVSLQSMGSGDNQPLLDSRFPDVASKGRGYILQTTPNGTNEWPALRKMSVWQSAAALQKEFYNRTSLQAQAKVKPTAAVTTASTTSTTIVATTINRVNNNNNNNSGDSKSSKESSSGEFYSALISDNLIITPSSSSAVVAVDNKESKSNSSSECEGTSVSPSNKASSSATVLIAAESKSSSTSKKTATVLPVTAPATATTEVSSRFVMSGHRTVDELYDFLISLSSNPKAITGEDNNDDSGGGDSKTTDAAVDTTDNAKVETAIVVEEQNTPRDTINRDLPTANVSYKNIILPITNSNNNNTNTAARFLRGAMPHHLPPLAAALVKSPDLQQSLKMGTGSMSAWDPLTGAPLGHTGSSGGSSNSPVKNSPGKNNRK